MEFDLPIFDDLKQENDIEWKIDELSNNNLDVVNEIFIEKILSNPNINSDLNYIIKQNIKTFDILIKHEKYSSGLRLKIIEKINDLLKNKILLTINWQYADIIDSIISLYNLSEKYWLGFSQDNFFDIISKQSMKVILSYLKNRKVWNYDLYQAIINHINNNLKSYLKDEFLFKYDEDFSDFNFSRIKNLLESDLWLLDVYLLYLNEDNLCYLKKNISKYISKNIIPYYKMKFISNYEFYSNDYEFYSMFYTLKRRFWKIYDTLWLGKSFLNWFNFSERIKNYEEKKSKKNTKSEPYQKPDKNVVEKDKYDDISTKYNLYLDNLKLKYCIYNHCNKMWNEKWIEYYEDFFGKFDDLDFLQPISKKREFIIFYINLLNEKWINIYSSTKIRLTLLGFLKLFIWENICHKKYLFSFLSSIWLFSYVYSNETSSKNELSNDNIDFIEILLKSDQTLYNNVKDEIISYSFDKHRKEISMI
jgi:hypothetical protein